MAVSTCEGGRSRKKPAGTTAAVAPTIHLPPDDLGEETVSDTEPPAASENGDAPAPVKKKTRRGSRGGKNRRKRTSATAAATSENGSEPASEPELEPELVAEVSAAQEDEWGYVPMSEWGDEFEG